MSFSYGPHTNEGLLGAAAVELTADDLKEIDAASARIKVQGDRYPEKPEQMTGR